MSDCASQPFPRFRREGRVGRPGDIVLLLPLALSTKCITCLQLLRALWALWAAPQAGPPRCFCQLRPHPRSAPMSSPCSQPYCPPLTASLGSVQMSFHCSHPPTWLPQQQRCPGKELGVKSAATSMEGVGGGAFASHSPDSVPSECPGNMAGTYSVKFLGGNRGFGPTLKLEINCTSVGSPDAPETVLGRRKPAPLSSWVSDLLQGESIRSGRTSVLGRGPQLSESALLGSGRESSLGLVGTPSARFGSSKLQAVYCCRKIFLCLGSCLAHVPLRSRGWTLTYFRLDVPSGSERPGWAWAVCARASRDSGSLRICPRNRSRASTALCRPWLQDHPGGGGAWGGGSHKVYLQRPPCPAPGPPEDGWSISGQSLPHNKVK